MKAVIFKGVGKYEIEDRPIPEVRKADDVKLKILAASICGSDVHILADPPGIDATPNIILGHECIAEIEDVGEEVMDLKVGDRVIMDNNLTCGVCKMCRLGHPNMCIRMNSMGSMSDGIFTEYAVVPEKALIKISKDIPMKQAILAEPMNCTMGGMKKLNVLPGATAVVLGGGPIGLCFTAEFKARGAGRVIVSEMTELRTKVAYEVGADLVVNPAKESQKDKIMELTDGLGADIVVDCVGMLMQDAVDCVRPCGQVLLFGMNKNAVTPFHQIDITYKDLTVYGSYIGSYALTHVANILNTNAVDLSKLVTHEYALEDFGEALQAMRTQQAVKTVLYPHGKVE